MTHNFKTELAEIYGIEGAIIIHNLYFWIEKNRANQKHFYDGRYWTYNTLNALAELFQYMAPMTDGKNGKPKHRRTDKIQRIIQALEDKGAIIKGNYNATAYDRTVWYAISEECLMHYRNIHNAESQNGKFEIAPPIPDSKQQILNTDNKLKELTLVSSKKLQFLDCVKLTEDEYQKLIEHFLSEETAKEKIQVLNDYIMSKGKKYSSHYHTILNWDRMDKNKKATSTQFNPLRTRLKPDGSPFRVMTPEEGENTYDRITMAPKADFIITDTGKYIGLDWEILTKFPSAGNCEFPTVKGSTKVKRLPEDEKQAYCRFFSLEMTDLELRGV